MSDSDDVTETVISGEPYDRAALLTKRFYPMGLRAKILACILTIASTTVLAPATYSRRNLIAALEGESAAVGAIEPGFSAVSLAGTIVTALCAVVLLRFLWRVETGSLTVEEAVDVIRIEDAVMTVAISAGVVLVLVCVALSFVGFLAPELAAGLYRSGVEIYVGGTGLFAVDTRITSGVGGAPTIGLLLVYLLVTGEGRAHVART